MSGDGSSAGPLIGQGFQFPRPPACLLALLPPGAQAAFAGTPAHRPEAAVHLARDIAASHLRLPASRVGLAASREMPRRVSRDPGRVWREGRGMSRDPRADLTSPWPGPARCASASAQEAQGAGRGWLHLDRCTRASRDMCATARGTSRSIGPDTPAASGETRSRVSRAALRRMAECSTPSCGVDRTPLLPDALRVSDGFKRRFGQFLVHPDTEDVP